MKKIIKNNKVVISVIAFILIIAIGIALDYTDILYFISKHFNYDFLVIFIPNIVLIFVFCITYYLIDKKNMEKEEKINRNKLNILNIMMQKTFNTCKIALDKFINDSYTMERFIVIKASSKKDNDINIIKDFQNLPFSFDDQIMKMMYDGLVDKEIINKYLEIKDLYKLYVQEKINLYDLLQYDADELNNLKKSIEKDNEKLTSLLDEELKRIEKFIKE